MGGGNAGPSSWDCSLLLPNTRSLAVLAKGGSRHPSLWSLCLLGDTGLSEPPQHSHSQVQRGWEAGKPVHPLSGGQWATALRSKPEGSVRSPSFRNPLLGKA